VIVYPYSTFTIESSTPTLRITLNERTIPTVVMMFEIELQTRQAYSIDLIIFSASLTGKHTLTF
jgi:hypothetical protein